MAAAGLDEAGVEDTGVEKAGHRGVLCINCPCYDWAHLAKMRHSS
jgi:hypothetical protein